MMKMPMSPPPMDELLKRNGSELLRIIGIEKMSLKGRYLHWDELRHRHPPEGFNHEQWWLSMKLARGSSTYVPLRNATESLFHFSLPTIVQEHLHYIDTHSAFEENRDIVTEEVRRRFVVSALMEESITSSQLEGAATTRSAAQEMLRYGRTPKDKSEIMILNNYIGMQEIRKQCKQHLTKKMVLSLHAKLTQGTLENPEDAGRLQTPEEERVKVVDHTRTTLLHAPPPAEQLQRRFKLMLDFANDEDKCEWIHPLIRAIIFHFWLAFDHPFVDGNGRTARSMFYWYTLKHNYTLFEFLPISSLLLEAPAKYYRSFLYTETDDCDLTYFIIHQLEIIRKAIDRLNDYLAKKMGQVNRIEVMLRDKKKFNYRQLALLGHAIRHPGIVYTVKSHQNSHDIAYATARADLLGLSKLKLLLTYKGGHAILYEAPDDLEALVRAL